MTNITEISYLDLGTQFYNKIQENESTNMEDKIKETLQLYKSSLEFNPDQIQNIENTINHITKINSIATSTIDESSKIQMNKALKLIYNKLGKLIIELINSKISQLDPTKEAIKFETVDIFTDVQQSIKELNISG